MSKRFLLLLFFAIATSSANAAVLTISSGKLTGATGVLVNGNLYDVTFADQTTNPPTGSCVDVFAGCDPSLFAFSTLAGAQAAGQALLDQVLIGIYDTDPELTFGCVSTANCLTRIPFAAGSGNVSQVVVVNLADAGTDSFFNESLLIDNPTTFTNVNFAVFTAVPEPATLALMALALPGLCFARKRRAA